MASAAQGTTRRVPAAKTSASATASATNGPKEKAAAAKSKNLASSSTSRSNSVTRGKRTEDSKSTKVVPRKSRNDNDKLSNAKSTTTGKAPAHRSDTVVTRTARTNANAKTKSESTTELITRSVTQSVTQRAKSAVRKTNYRTFKKEKPELPKTNNTDANENANENDGNSVDAASSPPIKSESNAKLSSPSPPSSPVPQDEPKVVRSETFTNLKDTFADDDDEPIILDENDIVYFNETEVMNVKDDGFIDTLVYESHDDLDVKPNHQEPRYGEKTISTTIKSTDRAGHEVIADGQVNDLGSSGFDSYQEDVVLPLAERMSQSMMLSTVTASSGERSEPFDTEQFEPLHLPRNSPTFLDNAVNESDEHNERDMTMADDKVDVLQRLFGAHRVRQADVQTHDRIDCESQTESCTKADKFAQHPHFLSSTGSFGSQEAACSQDMPISDPFQLCNFLLRAEKIVELIAEKVDAQTLAERNSARCSRRVLKIPPGSEQFCTSFYKLVCSPLAKNSPITYVHADQQYMYSVQAITREHSAERSLISVWPTEQATRPEHLLIARSSVTCCTSDQNGRTFAGMADGSVAVWDVCEPGHYHRSLLIESVPFTLRSPSYSTALVSNSNDAHKQPIVSVHVLPESASVCAKSDQESCLVASVDIDGIVIIWQLRKIYQNDVSYGKEGEGMLPGSSIKLQRKSTFTSTRLTSAQVVNCSAKSPTLTDHVYMGTNFGHIIRASRFTDDTMLPAVYENPFADTIASVSCLAFSPSNTSNFIAGYSDGGLALFIVSDDHPEQLWDAGDTTISEIVSVCWDNRRTSIFAVLDTTSSVFLWDLASNSHSALWTFSLTKLKSMSLLSSAQLSAIIAGTEDGNIEVMVLNDRVGANARDFRLGTLMSLFGRPGANDDVHEDKS